MGKLSIETPPDHECVDTGENTLTAEALPTNKQEEYKRRAKKSRMLIPLVLVGALFLTTKAEETGDETIPQNEAVSLIERIARQCEVVIKNFKKEVQDEELIKAKVGECFMLGVNREELIIEKQEADQKIRKKMKPLLSVIPENVQKRLKGFDPEKFKTLEKAFAVIDDAELGEDAKAAFRFLMFDDKGEMLSDPERLIILRELGAYDSPNFLTALLVHELYGHGFDDEMIDTEWTIYDSEGYSIEGVEKVLKSTRDRRHRSEFRARYVDNVFVDWLIKEGFMKKEEIDSADALENDTFVPEFYYLYKEATTSNDWSKFKKRIIAHYELADKPEEVIDQIPEEQRGCYDYNEMHARLIVAMEKIVSEKFSHLITPEKPKI